MIAPSHMHVCYTAAHSHGLKSLARPFLGQQTQRPWLPPAGVVVATGASQRDLNQGPQALQAPTSPDSPGMHHATIKTNTDDTACVDTQLTVHLKTRIIQRLQTRGR
jgi:hypothetical protein